MANLSLIPPLDEEGQVPIEEPVPISDFEATLQDLPPPAPVLPEAPPAPNPDVLAQMHAEFAPPTDEEAGVDAISGGAQPVPANDFAAYMERQIAPPVEPKFDVRKEEATLQASPVPEEVYQPDLVAKEQERLRGLTGEQLQQEAIQQQLDTERHAAQFRAEEEDKVARAQAEAATTFKTAIAKTQSDMTALRARADEIAKREPEGFFSGGFDASKIGGLIKAIAIGLVSPLHGLASLNKEFDDDLQRQAVQAQTDINMLGKQAGLLGEELALHGDLYKAQQAVNLAWKQKLPSMLSAEMSKYDQAGSTAMKLEGARRQAIADAQKAHAQAEKEQLEFNIKAGEFDLKQRADFRAQKTFERNMAPKPGARRFPASYWNQLYPGANVPEGAMFSDKEFGQYIGRRGDIQKLTGRAPEDEAKAVELEKSKLELEQARRGDVINDSTGAVLGKPKAKSEEQRGQIRDAVASYESFRPKITELIDMAETLNGQYQGAGSERWSTPERTEYNARRRELGRMLARVQQPTGILTKEDIAEAAEQIPKPDSWTRNNNPRATFRATTDLMDSTFDATMPVHIDGWDPERSPTKRAKALDAQALAPSVKPAEEPPPGPNDPSMLLGILPTHGGGYGAGASRDAPLDEKLRDSGIREPVK